MGRSSSAPPPQTADTNWIANPNPVLPTGSAPTMAQPYNIGTMPSENIFTQAQQGITGAGLGTLGEMFYDPQQVQAAQAASTGYQAPTISGVTPITAQQIQAGQLAGTNLSPYMNPFISDVIGQTSADLERQRLIQQGSIGAQAQRAGAFGGSRQAVESALTNEAFTRQLAQTSAGLRQAGFQQAQAAAGQDIASQMQAALANQAAGLQAQTTTGQFGMQQQLANQAAMQQAGQFDASAANQAAFANQQAAMQAALANQQAGLAGSQQRLGAAGQLGNIANLGFGMGQTVQQQMAQQGLQQQMLQQALMDAARGQYAGYTGAPAQSLGFLASALGATPVPQTTTTTKEPGLFDYLTLAATAASGTNFNSDIRLKTNIKRIGTLPNGLPLYQWAWNEIAKKLGIDDNPTTGVMAHEAREVMPEAVIEGEDGYLRVNYGMILGV